MITLLDEVTADGSSVAVACAYSSGILVAWGTFGGGTVQLEISPDDGTTWCPISGMSLTAAGAKPFALNFSSTPTGVKLRVTVSGSTTPVLSAGIL